MKQPFRWLDRRIAAPGPFLTLCLRLGRAIVAANYSERQALRQAA